MIAPRRRRGQEPYASTTERTLAAEKRIARVVVGLLNAIEETDYMLAPEHSLMKDRRVGAGLRLLKDLHRPYQNLYREEA